MQNTLQNVDAQYIDTYKDFVGNYKNSQIKLSASLTNDGFIKVTTYYFITKLNFLDFKVSLSNDLDVCNNVKVILVDTMEIVDGKEYKEDILVKLVSKGNSLLLSEDEKNKNAIQPLNNAMIPLSKELVSKISKVDIDPYKNYTVKYSLDGNVVRDGNGNVARAGDGTVVRVVNDERLFNTFGNYLEFIDSL